MDREFSLDLTNIPHELRIILDLLKKDIAAQNMSRDLFNNVDWGHFIELNVHHRLYPIMFNKLKTIDIVPTFVMDTLYELYRKNTFQMLRFTAEMEKVDRLFSGEQIRLLFLKGPNLGHDLYGDISKRTSSDLDILIPIDQLENAERILLSQGYEKIDYIKTVLNDWRWRHHHVSYVHPVKKIKLEVHWRLNPGPAAEPHFNELWNRKRRSGLIEYPIYTLEKEVLFCFLVSHGARHGWSRLRWLLDVQQLVKQDMDWGKTTELLKSYDLTHIGGQGIILAFQLLNAKVPKKVEFFLLDNKAERLAEQAIFYLEKMINLHTNPVPVEISRYHKYHLSSLMSLKQKTLFRLSFFYPYPEDAETLPLPKSLHLLYFPLRPFLWAWRKARKLAFP